MTGILTDPRPANATATATVDATVTVDAAVDATATADANAATATTAHASTLRALIRHQQGVLSAAQAAAHGLPHETLRQRVLRGIWQRLLPGVYALQCGPPTWRQWLIAALVYAGDGSMLTGPAALLEHAIPVPTAPATPELRRPAFITPATPELRRPISRTTNPLDSSHSIPAIPVPIPASLPNTPRPPAIARIDVLVPHRTRRQGVPGAPGVPGVRVIRTTRLPAPTEPGPIRLAPPARAVVDACFDAAARGDISTVEAIADQALTSGHASLAELEAELTQAPRRHSSQLRNHLARRREQARAAAARRLAAAADSLGCQDQDRDHGQGRSPAPGHGRPLRDVVVYSDRFPVARAAALWPSRAVAAAVDAPPQELESLKRLGFAVIQVAAHHVADDLPGVLRRIGGVLRERPQAVLPAGVSMVVDVSSRSRPGLSAS